MNAIKKSILTMFTSFRCILSLLIILLLFYPLFGGKLLILNGMFIYFSYFLSSILLIILIVSDLLELYSIVYVNKSTQKEKIFYNNLSFIFVSLLMCIGLLQGHYICSALWFIIYISSMFFYLYNIIVDKTILYQFNNNDLIQRATFYLFSFFCLIGNQPFEYFNIPFVCSSLIILNIVTIINIYMKINKKQGV